MEFSKLGEIDNGARGPYFGKSAEEAAMLVMINLGKAIRRGGDGADDNGNPVFDVDFWDAHTIIHLLAKAYTGTQLPQPHGGTLRMEVIKVDAVRDVFEAMAHGFCNGDELPNETVLRYAGSDPAYASALAVIYADALMEMSISCRALA